MKQKKRGLFITLEGGEGAGKTTQIHKLSTALSTGLSTDLSTSHTELSTGSSQGLSADLSTGPIEHIVTREPGGSAGAEAIRELIVTGAAERWDPITETLLIMAARCDHVRNTVEPALNEGKWVISDRYFDSTRVYQGITKGVDKQWLEQLYTMLFGNLQPDLTIYLDIDPEIGLKRTQSRTGNETRFESLPIEFHQTLRQGFLALSEAEPQRIYVVDASQDEESVHQQIMRLIGPFCSSHQAEAA